MKVQIKLMGMLKDKSPPNGQLELADGSTIADALATLDIAPEKVQVITVNGSVERDRSRDLSEGDELSMLPPVGGG